MAVKMVKRTFSLPPEVHEHLGYVSRRIGVSRSALLVGLIAEPLADMAALFEDLGESPTEADVVRFRGKSRDLVEQRIEGLRRHENDLFS